MTEELIIDNQAVDLDAGTAVTLNFKSNLLGDIDAIESNYSQTITLPKTAHNRAVLDNPTAPSYASTFRRVRHSVQYRRNGVQVIRNGYAVLLDSTDGYEIAVYWGIKADLQSWLDESPNIGDLGWEPTEGITTWAVGNVSANVLDAGFTWAVYNAGIDAKWFERAGVARHPFVSTWIVFSLIMEKLGIEWNAGDEVREAIRETGIFLPTRNEDNAEAHESTALSMGARGLSVTFADSGWFTLKQSEKSCSWFEYKVTHNIFTVNYDGRATVEISLNMRASSGGGASAYNVGVYVYLNGNEIGFITQWIYTGSTETLAKSFSFDCEADDEISVICGADMRSENNNLSVESGSYIRFTPPGEDEPIDLLDPFPASKNMPEISQLDFFKAICAMFGLYVMPTAGDAGLQIVSFESLTGNRANAVDWSDRLVSSGTAGEPEQVAFSFGDWARTNRFRYKDSEDVEKDADGAIYIQDEALDDEYDVIELPFTACDESAANEDYTSEGVKVCDIPHYSWDGDEPTEDSGEESSGNVLEIGTLYESYRDSYATLLTSEYLNTNAKELTAEVVEGSDWLLVQVYSVDNVKYRVYENTTGVLRIGLVRFFAVFGDGSSKTGYMTVYQAANPDTGTDEEAETASANGDIALTASSSSDDDFPDVDSDTPDPRIVKFSAVEGYVYAQFSPDMTFSRLIATWHATLTAMLQDAIVITEEFRLTEHDLLNLDYLRPVYLRQYGRYYGIVSIQTKDDNICEAELVQLPLPE